MAEAESVIKSTVSAPLLWPLKASTPSWDSNVNVVWAKDVLTMVIVATAITAVLNKVIVTPARNVIWKW